MKRVEIASRPVAILARAARRPRIRSVRRLERDIDRRRFEGDPHTEDRMKELSLEEVLRIAGGVPAAAALDEVTYREPAEPHAEPVDYAHLAEGDLRASRAA